jgi:dUTP pyrophosphatase
MLSSGLDVVKIMNLKSVKSPTQAYDGAGAWDFYLPKDSSIELGINKIPLGVALEMPPNLRLLLHDKSSRSLNFHVVGGLIDSDYRGELILMVYCYKEIKLLENDKVVQGKFEFVPSVQFQKVSQLNNTLRGTGGFGSSS